MDRKRRGFLIAVFAVIFIFLSISSFGYWLFFTTKGSSFIVRVFLSRYTKSHDINVNKTDGTLSQAMIFQDLVIEDFEGLPEGSVIEVKRLEISLKSLHPKGLNAEIHNAKFKIPDLEPVFFHGTCEEGLLDINVYSKSIDVKEIAHLLKNNETFKNISGSIKDLDIYVLGEIAEPGLKGGFDIEKISRGVFSVENCQVSFDLKLKDIMGEARLYGDLILKGGSVHGLRTAIINFQESKISFNGDFKSILFDLKGTSNVDGAEINVGFKGTTDNPDLRLSSNPPLPKERIMLRLATNRSWTGTEVALNQAQISPEAAKDFIGYFFSSGSVGRLAKYLGISDIFLKYDDKAKGVGVKKDVSGKAEVSYSVEQLQTKEEKEAVTHKIGSEYKITDTVTIDAERELKQSPENDEETGKIQPDDTVLLKYKRKF